MEPYWETNGHAPHPVKYESDAAVSGFPYCSESGLNFSTSAATYSEDDTEYNTGRRGKTSRQDPLSHRIIEKRRRDRMNSCLADLSRLIPPQYQRKGRGRIEKTEIIEMAIRHLKHLQNECVHKEIEYKMGYSDCMKEAAKFLYDSHAQDFCYRLITHLQEHCDEIMKSDCYKNKCNADSISASSDSPSAHNYHPTAPLSQLRDMLTSDVDHSNSNDHNDVKDLSFRSQPHQAPVITSTAPPIAHHDSSNNDFDSPRDRRGHLHENDMPSPPHLHHSSESILKSVRLRNFSESSHDVEHNNNNYKYKNHIKQRFNQDSHLHDESTNDYSIANNNHGESVNADHSKVDLENGNCKKRKMEPSDEMENGNYESKQCNQISDEAKPGSPTVTKSMNGTRHLTVPIFALHGQGTYYVPLNVDYEALLPYLRGIDLLDKSYCSMSAMHPVNINVNFAQGGLVKQNFVRTKTELVTNGW